MRILFVNAYFIPEVTAVTNLTQGLIEGMVAKGHEIEVLCPTPTRDVPKGMLPEYKSKKSEVLYDGKVHVTRFWAPQEKKHPLIRAFRYVWCNYRQYRLGKKYKEIDAIFATSTPPTQGMFAGKLSKKLGCPFIYSLQDIFPDSLVTTGLAKEQSLVWKMGRWIEKKTYNRADRIVVISKSCRLNLLNKGVPEDKLSLISNWTDVKGVYPIRRKDNKLLLEFPIHPEHFLVVYAGNFGAAQGADIVLKVAAMLTDKKDIHFVIFGGGAEFEAAVNFVQQQELKNITIHPLLPQERVSEVYSLGDVALITCKPGVGNSGMPSKTWNIMACNTPIIASFDVESDLNDILQSAQAGRCVPAGDEAALKNAILYDYERWKGGNVELTDTREYVMRHANRDSCVEKYMELICEAVRDHER